MKALVYPLHDLQLAAILTVPNVLLLPIDMSSQSQPQDEQQNSTVGIVTFFSNDYSFQVQETCWEQQRVDLEAACRIHFNSNGTVIRYGNETIPGTFEPNSDIAGLGV